MSEFFRSPFFASKLLEIVLAVICTLLIGDLLPMHSALQVELIHTAIYGYLLLNLIIIIGLLLDEPVPRRLCIIISATGFIFNVLSAVILIGDAIGISDVSKRILSAGLVAVLSAIVFLLDTGYSYIYVTD